MNAFEEEWRPVHLNAAYEVSNLGRVRSWKRVGISQIRRDSPLIMKQRKDKRGFSKVSLQITPSKKYFINVHQLVAHAFLGPKPCSDSIIKHYGNRDNNAFYNLYWGYRDRGEDKVNSKLTEEEALKIRDSSETLKQLSEKYGVHRMTISYIKNRKNWKYIG